MLLYYPIYDNVITYIYYCILYYVLFCRADTRPWFVGVKHYVPRYVASDIVVPGFVASDIVVSKFAKTTNKGQLYNITTTLH